MRKVKASKMSTKTLVRAAILVAASIVLSLGSIMILPTLKLGFGQTPLLLSGFLFGPMVGGVSGLVADLISFVINPQGPYHPGFTLSSIMWGVITGIFAKYFRSKESSKGTFSLLRVSIAVTVAMAFISLGLNTFWLSKLYGKGFIVMLPGRISSFIVSTPINAYIITILLKYIRPMVENK